MRGLVLSGGGANGAFEVGALQHIIGEKKIHYDVICGVSVGALNGSILAQYPEGQEEASMEHLSNIWEQVNRDSDIYKKWYGGWLWHLPALWKRSIYCTAPLQKIVHEHVNEARFRTSDKQLFIGAVCLNTGEYKVWDKSSPDITEAILASSSFPVFFEPVQINHKWYTDGGLRDITPIKAAIDAGCTRIDVIQCGSAELLQFPSGAPSTLKQVQIMLEVVFDEIDRNDYEKAQMINKLVKAGVSDKKLIELHRIRHLISLGDSLDFNQEKKDKNMALGKRLATAYSAW